MGQKVHPLGFRLGSFRDWQAHWYARGSYGRQVLEDLKIRKFLSGALEAAEIAAVLIEKAGDDLRIVLQSGRPGVVIGRRGQEIESLRSELATKLKRSNVEISVQEIKNPALNAHLVAENIAKQLVRRANFKRVSKQAVSEAMSAGAMGIRVATSGRLNGAEIARREWNGDGSLPLQTLRFDVDYGVAEARTTYGIIGVKVWICKGKFPLSTDSHMAKEG